MEGTTLTLIQQQRKGLKNIFKNLLKIRFEMKVFVEAQIDADDQELTINALTKLGGPSQSSLKRRQTSIIFLYHILRNYKGWRYIRNLPIHGQRT